MSLVRAILSLDNFNIDGIYLDTVKDPEGNEVKNPEGEVQYTELYDTCMKLVDSLFKIDGLNSVSLEDFHKKRLECIETKRLGNDHLMADEIKDLEKLNDPAYAKDLAVIALLLPAISATYNRIHYCNQYINTHQNEGKGKPVGADDLVPLMIATLSKELEPLSKAEREDFTNKLKKLHGVFSEVTGIRYYLTSVCSADPAINNGIREKGKFHKNGAKSILEAEVKKEDVIKLLTATDKTFGNQELSLQQNKEYKAYLKLMKYAINGDEKRFTKKIDRLLNPPPYKQLFNRNKKSKNEKFLAFLKELKSYNSHNSKAVFDGFRSYYGVRVPEKKPGKSLFGKAKDLLSKLSFFHKPNSTIQNDQKEQITKISTPQQKG